MLSPVLRHLFMLSLGWISIASFASLPSDSPQVPEFLAHVKQSGARVDFVSTHTNGVQGGFLDEDGKSDTRLEPSPDAICGDVRRVHDQISASPFTHLPLYITEWSTSYFEEPGPPTAPFQGGFGLLDPEGIRKPAFFAYKYHHAMQGFSLGANDPQVWLSIKGGNFVGAYWDFEQPHQKVSNRSFDTKVIPNYPAAPIQLQQTHLARSTAYHLKIYRTGYHANDAYTAYLEIGSPKVLSPAQIAHLNELTRSLLETDRIVRTDSGGKLGIFAPMRSNDVVLIKITRGQGGK